MREFILGEGVVCTVLQCTVLYGRGGMEEELLDLGEGPWMEMSKCEEDWHMGFICYAERDLFS